MLVFQKNFKNFYTLIVHFVINFVFSIGKQPYREAINFVSFIHVVYNYKGISYYNSTPLYMRTNYLCHVANIIDSGVGLLGEGGPSPPKFVNLLYTWGRPKMCSNFAVADKHDVVLL